jgi:surface polysaccharide O-acyltransferase-like enzyme
MELRFCATEIKGIIIKRHQYLIKTYIHIYIVHYLVIATIGYFLKAKTQMPPAFIYVILTIAVFTLSPLLYELLKRIPFIRWCILGEKK